MPNENQVIPEVNAQVSEPVPVLPEVEHSVPKVEPLTIEGLFNAVAKRLRPTFESPNYQTKFHLSKDKAKQKRKVAKASRKKNRS